jgi:hypothetical protein
MRPALAQRAVPGLKRGVKWGMAYYGVSDGWCFSSGAFVGHVKLMFIRGTEIHPEPPVTPTGMGKSTRGVELKSGKDLDEDQLMSWMGQAATKPFLRARSRSRVLAQDRRWRHSQHARRTYSRLPPLQNGSVLCHIGYFWIGPTGRQRKSSPE